MVGGELMGPTGDKTVAHLGRVLYHRPAVGTAEDYPREGGPAQLVVAQHVDECRHG